MAYTKPSNDGWRWSSPGPSRGITTPKLITTPGTRTGAGAAQKKAAQNKIAKSIAIRKRRANVKMKQTRGLG